MIICVVTPYDSNNFGAFLQAYALKRVLELDGHTVHHIRLRSGRETRRLFYTPYPSMVQLGDVGDWIKGYRFGRRKRELFARDAARLSTVDLKSAATADVVVLGSDEIWNIRHRSFRKPVFYGRGFQHVIAYAPSVGSARYEDFCEHAGLIEDLRRVEAVMVRDANTADFVTTATSVTPPLVIDPTMLYRWSESLPSAEDGYLDSHKYLLVYAYNSKHLPVDQLRLYAGNRGLKIVSAGFHMDWCDRTVNCSPLEFLDVVARAECVFTTTFHGSIAAILKRRQFLSHPTSPKTEDLLGRLGLLGRVYRGRLAEAMESELLYEEVFERIEAERASSQAILRRALARMSESNGANPSGEQS